MSGEIVKTVVQGSCEVSGSKGDVFTTILGSCVAVCLFDPTRRVGGMNHFLLPGGSNSKGNQNIKYGTHAMELLINKILQLGGKKDTLQAKLFGGASLNAKLGAIGENNILFARDFLKVEAIDCVAESLGGVNARRLRFNPTTGHARLLTIPNCELDQSVLTPTAEVVEPPSDITMF